MKRCKIRKIQAELEEEDQSIKDELAKEGKGATGPAEEEDVGRRNSTEDSGEHRG